MKKTLGILTATAICLAYTLFLTVPVEASYGNPGSIPLAAGPVSATGTSSISIRSGNSSTSSPNGSVGLYVSATYWYNENAYKPGATIVVKSESGWASNYNLAYKGFSAGDYDQSIRIDGYHSASSGGYEAHGETVYYYN